MPEVIERNATAPAVKRDTPPAPQQPKLLDQMRERIRVKHYSLSTERTYLYWARFYIHFHGLKHPRERGAKVRANREVAVLSNIMQQAIEMGLIDANPCKQVRRNTESPRERDVTDAEVAGLMAHTPTWLDAYLAIKSLTGLRQGDMLRLGRFNERDDGLFVQTGKRNKRLLFAWTPSLRAAIDEAKALRRKSSEARFFPISPSGFKTAWSRAMHKYDGERFAENDLRAKVASAAIDKGMDAASMLGHSSDAVTRRHYIRGTRKVQPLG